MSAWPRAALYAFCALIAFFLVAPTLVLVPMSFSSGNTLRFPPPGFSLQWYETLFTSQAWIQPAIVSLQVGVFTSILATVLGTMAAFGLVRGRFPGKAVANALIISPMVVPLVIVAIGMFAVFVRWRIAGSGLGLILAHTVLALPFVVVNVRASLSTMDRNLERASLSLGADPLKTFRFVTLPQIMPGVLSGALFAFIVSWDEVVLAIFLTSPFLQTLPVTIWQQVRTEVDPTVAAVGTCVTLLTTVLFATASVMRRRGERA